MRPPGPTHTPCFTCIAYQMHTGMRHSRRETVATLRPDLMAVVLEHNRCDVDLYRHATRRFRQQLAELDRMGIPDIVDAGKQSVTWTPRRK